VRLTPEARGYAPLPFHWVLAGKARAGTIFGDIPVTQRYLAGGGSSQRGFPERRLAPTITRTLEDGTTRSVVIGGGGLAETSLELRIPLSKWWKLDWGMVVFLDGADVAERLDQIDVLNLHWATGAGLRIGTPIGPVRFDVGYRLNRKGPGEIRPDDHFAYHLSLGEAF
jgi:outer membrane protein insertion porin family